MSDQSASPPTAPVETAPQGEGRNRRVAPIIVIAVTLVIAAFFVILIQAKSETGESAYSPLLGDPAPAVETTTLDGKPFDLQRRKGSWVVLNFFNATCGPCVAEHPELVKFADQQAQPGATGAELYSVVWNDIGGETAAFFDSNTVTWPVLLDENAQIGGAFGVSKVPETWIIDPNGYVVFRTISEQTDDSLTRFLSEQVAVYNGVPPAGDSG